LLETGREGSRKKGVCKVCAGEIIKMFEDELKGKPSKK